MGGLRSGQTAKKFIAGSEKPVRMPSADVGGVAADCRGWQSAVWHARPEFELLTLLAHEGDDTPP